ncbi:MAG: Sec-independent protein translocase protein TatB [Thermodesulfobacteriota bacterium]|nr:MAG: Sec-independent protein translocase protein TatB [Thermodesulfobacteriota bacterium]
MFGIGFSELLVILVVALLVIGPDKLPEVARTLAKAFNEFRRATLDIKRTVSDIDLGVRESFVKEPETEAPAKESVDEEAAPPPKKPPVAKKSTVAKKPTVKTRRKTSEKTKTAKRSGANTGRTG